MVGRVERVGRVDLCPLQNCTTGVGRLAGSMKVGCVCDRGPDSQTVPWLGCLGPPHTKRAALTWRVAAPHSTSRGTGCTPVRPTGRGRRAGERVAGRARGRRALTAMASNVALTAALWSTSCLTEAARRASTSPAVSVMRGTASRKRKRAAGVGQGGCATVRSRGSCVRRGFGVWF